jgi:hypothetical protein
LGWCAKTLIGLFVFAWLWRVLHDGIDVLPW